MNSSGSGGGGGSADYLNPLYKPKVFGGTSGGGVYLSAPAITVAPGALVSAAGGAGGIANEYATGGVGGAGGLGRIRLSITPASCAIGGTLTPALASGCAPTPGGTPGFAYVGVHPN